MLGLLLLLAGCEVFATAQPQEQSKLPASTLTATQTPQAEQSTQPDPQVSQNNPPTAVSAAIEYHFPSPSSIPPSATLTQTPTITHTPTITLTPTEGPSPTSTRRPTVTVTRTNTPEAPFNYLRITRPGAFSKVVSPIKVEAMVTKGEDGFVYIDLIGEDQRLISNQELDYRWNEYSRFLIIPRVDFEIPGAAETARLLVSVRDNYGRTIAVSSVDLILLSIGRNDLEPVEFLDQPYIIQQPYEDQIVSGGKFVINGKIMPINAQPIFLELIDEENQIISITQIELPYSADTFRYHAFSIEMEYNISEVTPVLLTIFQQSDQRIQGIAALASRTIILAP